MSGPEVHYRIVGLVERIADLERDIERIESDVMDSAQLMFLHQAQDLASALRTKLRSVPTAESDLSAMLALSVQQFREKKRCAEIGAEILGADVLPFRG